MLGNPIRANIVLAATILVAGLAAAPTGVLAAGEPPATRAAGDGAAASADHPTNPAAELVIRSLSMLGVNYKWGGDSPDTGLDCSGLVRFVYEETLGKVLPRRSVEMSREGESVDRHELKPGDLVFFNTLRRAFSHVGIYIGNNQFVHAPSRGKQVRVESLESSYWAKRFNGARRLLAEDAQRAPFAFERPRQSLPAEFRSGL
ncbi:C40 family peptidase [Zeimonas arvi]|uniref:NlpC/P60 family protein n=1 Tax=Zeimonas arvi TaxID=2498847 RepID=A0A5C8NMR8_9BURK|nr:C40 family peptidase [Zeimonas arvi]TXL62436.1 NlpC/P60 family protein [Zeimonas arvi]